MIRQPGRRGWWGAAVTLWVAASLAGCAGGRLPLARPSPEALPPGSPLRNETLSLGDAWLRHHLAIGDPAAALRLFEPGREPPVSDALLVALQQALLYREGGDLGRSNELLEWAELEAERRRIRSVSRTAASFLVNDRVLEYTPTFAERAMIPFYRLLNHLELGDRDAAAVEARRISALLDRADVPQGCAAFGMLHYLAGLAFESAGELNDALVSIRRSEASYRSCGRESDVSMPPELGRDLVRIARAAGIPEVADSAVARYPDAARTTTMGADSAEVLVVLERGFVAHRTPEAVHVPLYDDELEGLGSGDEEGIAIRSAAIVARLTQNLLERERWGSSWDDAPAVQVAHALGGAHVLRFSWPSLAHPPRQRVPVARLLAGDAESSLQPVADLSALAEAELRAERPAMLARLVARSLAKYLVAREVEQAAEERGGELLGFLAGRIANLAANELERPDTRSWTLLPARITFARVRVPVKNPDVRLEIGGRTVDAISGIGERQSEVAAGEIRIVSLRDLGPPPAPDHDAEADDAGS